MSSDDGAGGGGSDGSVSLRRGVRSGGSLGAEDTGEVPAELTLALVSSGGWVTGSVSSGQGTKGYLQVVDPLTHL